MPTVSRRPHRLTFVHTSPIMVPIFSQLAGELLPGVVSTHTVDESLIKDTIAAGFLTKATVRRLVGLIGSAFDGGAAAVMVTCSSLGRGIELARELYDQPVLRVDEAMAEQAVRTARRIGVAATVKTTLDPTLDLLRETARRAGRAVELTPALCSGAFDAVLAGDGARHDALLLDTLLGLRDKVDLVVLAQASMARVLPQLEGTPGAPLLTSPRLAVQQARERLGV